MSRTVKQPIGQKRLTNVAVVRLRKHGNRFEIACFKNKVLSWRARVEKDIDEVLQTHTVFTNVSKGVLAKSKDLIQVFGTDDEDKVCLEILEKGELQVADKEREAQLSSQFRDIATIVMDKTVNPETERPYTITMIERLMREVHFAVDPHKNSKQQALELIRDLQKQFPITRARMKLRLVVPFSGSKDLMNILNSWNARIEAKEETSTSMSLVCQVDPGHFRECDSLVRELRGTLEVASMAVQGEGEGGIDEFNDDEEYNIAHTSHAGTRCPNPPETWDSQKYLENMANSVQAFPDVDTTMVEDEDHLAIRMREAATLSSSSTTGTSGSPNLVDEREAEWSRATSSSNPTTKGAGPPTAAGPKQQTCNTCVRQVGDAKQYREHFKSDWHKHNLKRKMKGLPPLSAEECLADTDIDYGINDKNDYSR